MQVPQVKSVRVKDMMIFEFRHLRGRTVRRIKITSVSLTLIIFLLIGCTPPARNAEPTSPLPTAKPTIHALANLTATSMMFVAEADTQVRESDPDLNYGNSTELMVDGEDDLDVESFLRFHVTGITGPIHAAHIRLYVTDNASRNSPTVYATDSSWDEFTLTWDRRPDPLSAPLDHLDEIYTDTWVEYDVVFFVAEDKTYSFVLVADSDDAVTFSSREGSHPPQLVITLADGPIATYGIPITGATPALTNTPSQGPIHSLTFTANTDARVKEADPDRNYGTSSMLQVDNGGDPDVESYIRFIVTEVTGQVLSAHLRVYVTVNGSKNGPAVYATDPNWTELGITWNLRPARTSNILDNKDRVREGRWIDYDVTSQVTGDGTYSFVLAG